MESAPAAHFDKMPQLLDYHGSRVTVRKADGAELAVAVSPYPAMLYAAVLGGRWEEAVRLCRFVKNKPLWACLAGMALQHRHLDTAELALAAIEDVRRAAPPLPRPPRPHTRTHTCAGAQAALCALCEGDSVGGGPCGGHGAVPARDGGGGADPAAGQAAAAVPGREDEHSSVQVEAVRQRGWAAPQQSSDALPPRRRALELAQQHGRLVDLVVAYRRKNLQETGDEEKLEEFKKLSDMQVDWDKVEQIKREERESEEKAA